ncbi:MAG: hypothetical protein UR85_C0004G0089 [Candidatus Nomurabacteria bacterium GW2011_GWF2_35_66]|uniref:Uncharacterized protein n=1 Tax=Candidatus Nomurabacteria bacterium GW2011_GWE1_35_16 TaxID=1618761 RepID=A0A0G0BBZ1_9BACT|nr:MAG: hypothetical protein UR55_C0002G0088 [Candidatus Nomurabacteria bacterium GW2011_GWF1_34_20]KKP63667.1 MAG: hypothetical protein UR57_C0002G0088 [Candidatus Nomurabacteria bacterium GW2011_GWE2_34_25]KKP66869.1 MAG: hypothetical protein UR64_C0002G0085 [Candidatus Nomurabacteria bacterium GW2011_GWE1_35_16]KKP83495.1 MAG: hypothetical protein UR85_C0004G0089 [Candidatus Nomurabacteria bacterium GW2011_GWF2_35_66]HAE36573.1 hypothetical protein [Candidatus Nomurabacteria bacterium]
MKKKKVKIVWLFTAVVFTTARERIHFEENTRMGILCQDKDIKLEICHVSNTRTGLIRFGTKNLIKWSYPNTIIFYECQDKTIKNLVGLIKVLTTKDFTILFKPEFGKKMKS